MHTAVSGRIKRLHGAAQEKDGAKDGVASLVR